MIGILSRAFVWEIDRDKSISFAALIASSQTSTRQTMHSSIGTTDCNKNCKCCCTCAIYQFGNEHLTQATCWCSSNSSICSVQWCQIKNLFVRCIPARKSIWVAEKVHWCERNDFDAAMLQNNYTLVITKTPTLTIIKSSHNWICLTLWWDNLKSENRNWAGLGNVASQPVFSKKNDVWIETPHFSAASHVVDVLDSGFAGHLERESKQ